MPIFLLLKLQYFYTVVHNRFLPILVANLPDDRPPLQNMSASFFILFTHFLGQK